jgi:hypothetical protein
MNELGPVQGFFAASSQYIRRDGHQYRGGSDEVRNVDIVHAPSPKS